MPYALVTVGLLLIITGINNTYAQFGAQLKSDFTGDKNFIMYIAALGGVGALGYISALRTFSHYFMALILISLVLSNRGFFQNLIAALNGPLAVPVAGSTGADQPALSPKSSTGALNSAITGNQTGAFGQSPETSGQAKFNGWVNWFLGLSTNSGN